MQGFINMNDPNCISESDEHKWIQIRKVLDVTFVNMIVLMKDITQSNLQNSTNFLNTSDGFYYGLTLWFDEVWWVTLIIFFTARLTRSDS